ncbi:6-phosphogluconate dehydrogenase C-terminal domain-like protein [Gautieria morchelliformis]|nr:6-phosphogluconate dehydrogenase C-terminal domain-like protein [Gautieria morchelliformis]
MAPLGPTIGLVSAGAMGAAVARRLTSYGYTVLTSLEGRSATSKERARMAGMQDACLEEIAKRARCVLSIIPPSSAVNFAHQFVHAIGTQLSAGETGTFDLGPGDRPAGMRLVFADCNAVAPATVCEIAGYFTGGNVDFVDACIIGGPPSRPSETPVYDPIFYASGPETAVSRFAKMLSPGGLKISTLKAAVGQASALKMGYAGINKGLTGLTAAMILATHAASPATSSALMHELSISQPALLERTTRMIPDMLPKAYRFVGEMEEIGDFVDAGMPGGTADLWKGLAALFKRVAGDMKTGAGDVEVLQDFVADAKATLQDAKK